MGGLCVGTVWHFVETLEWSLCRHCLAFCGDVWVFVSALSGILWRRYGGLCVGTVWHFVETLEGSLCRHCLAFCGDVGGDFVSALSGILWDVMGVFVSALSGILWRPYEGST